ncbi:MAG: phosphoribosyltransferase, partial [Saprospiraceae bacterium]|nr:phosphoribosyltransferase [Saprospiraceae bacterium]
MKILNESQIVQKIKRLSYEILENNFEEKSIVLLGINRNGLHFAQMLHDYLVTITEIPVVLTQVTLNPAAPLDEEVKL